MINESLRRSCMTLLALFIIVRVVIMIFTPLRDPSESRYAVMAMNMARTGDFVIPHFYHHGEYQSFDGKTSLFFQIAGLSVKAFGVNEFAVRLPSLLAALGIVSMVFFTVRKLRDATTAWLAATLTMTTPLFYVFAGISLTDMVLTFCICGALLSYMLFCNAEKKRTKKRFSILFFAFLGLGMLAKGPVAIVMAGLPVFLFTAITQRWKELKDHSWILGPLMFLVLVVPMYALLEKQNSGFLEQFFINENFKRFTTTTPDGYGDRYGSGHVTFKGMGFVWFVVATLPWLFLSGLMLPKFRKGDFPKLWARPLWGDPLTGMALCVAFGITGFWCLSSVALVYYLLPTTPLVCMFLADMAVRDGRMSQPCFMRCVRVVAYITLFGTVIGLGVSTVAGMYKTSHVSGAMFKNMRDIRRDSSELSRYHYYVAGATPYSAEFYLHDAVVQHPRESVEESLDASGDTILLIRTKHIPKEGMQNRRLIYKKGSWAAFAPEG